MVCEGLDATPEKLMHLWCISGVAEVTRYFLAVLMFCTSMPRDRLALAVASPAVSLALKAVSRVIRSLQTFLVSQGFWLA